MKAWGSGRSLDYRSIGCWFAPSLCYLVFSGHGAWNIKLRTLEYFTLYLRNRQSENLRAIESCVCSSIERNMMSIYGHCVYVWKVTERWREGLSRILCILTISLNCLNAECAQFLSPRTLLTCTERFLENKSSALWDSGEWNSAGVTRETCATSEAQE